jgi:hypothetical protein
MVHGKVCASVKERSSGCAVAYLDGAWVLGCC